MSSTIAVRIAEQRTTPRGSLHRFLRNPMGVVAAVILLAILVATACAGLLSPYDPNTSILNDAMAPISPEHPLGADRAGRDLLSRLLWGGQVTLLAAALALAIAMLIGIPSGLLAGYYGSWLDQTTSWITNLLMALPGIVVLLAVRAVVGPSVWVSMAVFGVLLAPAFYRLVRSAVANVRNELYVDAARVSGLSDARIIGRHVFTVVRAPIVIQAALVTSVALAVQSGLEFLGIGDARVPTWGALLNDAFRNINVAPQMLVWPGLVLALTCASLGLLANAIRDALEDRGSAPAPRRQKRPAAARIRADKDVAAVSAASMDETKPSPLLAVEGLEVSYAQANGEKLVVVHDVTVEVQPGEVLGIVGESGSGKTQTAFSVLGLLPAGGNVSAGRIALHGVDVAGLTRKQRAELLGTKIGYVPQEPMSNLDPSYRIGDQLDEPLRVRQGLSREQARARSLNLLRRVGIVDPERTYRAYPHEISGGMAQRVLIAGAIAADPQLLIADECTTALDVTVQAEVLELLRDLQRERGMGVILVTHNFGVVADICDRVAVMQSGRIVETGTVDQIFNDPQHPYTQMLLDSTLEDASLRAPLDTGISGGKS